MAQKIQVILVDDIDGGEAEETVSFSLDGVAYEIDLSTPNAEKLREAFALYVGSARRVGGRSQPRGRRGSSSPSTPARSGDGGSGGSGEVAAIREWARTNGHQVNERGRIAASVREAYEAAHASS